MRNIAHFISRVKPEGALLRSAILRADGQSPAMAGKRAESDRIRAAQRQLIQALVHALEWKTTKLATAAQLSPSTLNRFVNQDVGHTLTTMTMQAVMAAAEKRAAELLREKIGDATYREMLKPKLAALAAVARELRLDTKLAGIDVAAPGFERVRVVGEVQAGDWRDAMEWPPNDQFEIEVPINKNFPGQRRYALRVIGPSMDKYYPDGSIVVCVEIASYEFTPKTGDKVVCEKRRKDGLIEATIKEIVIDENQKMWLWPRSNHPEHQQPTLVNLRGDGDDECHIKGVVLALYREEYKP